MMTQFLAFVSCDIIGHSADPDLPGQRKRIQGINDIVKQVLEEHSPNTVIWASGGDGGHVAIATPDCIGDSVQLIVKFRDWSKNSGVRLRIVAHYGEVDWMEGAGGITQLIGPGINFVGRLIEYGDQDRIVVSTQFVDAAKTVSLPGVRFHDKRPVSLKYFPQQEAMLLSIDGRFQSEWNDHLLDNRSLLTEALQQGSSWDVIYHALRLLEVNSKDRYARTTLKDLASDGLTYKDMASDKIEPNPLLTLMNPDSRGDFIRSARLVEREKGEILCRYQDGGDTMFVILRGEIAVLSRPDLQLYDVEQTSKAIKLGRGEIVGELAYALRRKRTATLQCLTRTVFLSFSPSAIKKLSSKPTSGTGIQEAMERFLKLRILEHLCHNASYLIGKNRLGPLQNLKKPWERMYDHTLQMPFSVKDTQSISRQVNDFKEPGMYILVSGELREIQKPERILMGIHLPIVYADFPGELLKDLGTAQPKKIQEVVPDPLSGEEFQQLHDALLKAFPNHYAFQLMIRTGLGENPEVIAGGVNLGERVYHLLKWADAQNRVQELVEKAYGQNSKNRELSAFARPFLGLPPLSFHTTNPALETLVEPIYDLKSYKVIRDAILLRISPNAFENLFDSIEQFQAFRNAVRAAIRQPENALPGRSKTPQ